VKYADALESRSDAIAGAWSASRSEDLEVLPARQMAVEPRFVDNGADSRQCQIAMLGDRVSEKRHGAGVSVRQPQQHSNQGGLAGAVGTEVAERASSRDEKLDIVHRHVLAELLGQPVGLYGPATLGLMLEGVRVGNGARLLSFPRSSR
jgi:hypothetical protein